MSNDPFAPGRAGLIDRRRLLAYGLALAAPGAASSLAAESFQSFLAGLEPEAERAGVQRATFVKTIRSLAPDPAVLTRSDSQPEFETPMWTYVGRAAGPARVAKGREERRRWAPELAKIATRFGAPPEIVLAAWGMEADFTRPAQSHDVLSALATLAWTRPRATVFRSELFAALRMLQSGLADRSRLRGSWAGAMGMPQFMPSAYLRFAASFAGGRPPDIWNSTPDALASIANFFHASGWKPGLPWGFEVALPAGFAWRSLRGDFADWRGLGVRRMDGVALPRTGEATLFAPAGASGPCFLLSDNYWVVKQYDNSDSYALSLGLLAEAIAGRPGLRRPWPTGLRPLPRQARIRLQRRLAELRLYAGATDGKIGPSTRQAVHRFQLQTGLRPADGYPTTAVMAAVDGRDSQLR